MCSGGMENAWRRRIWIRSSAKIIITYHWLVIESRGLYYHSIRRRETKADGTKLFVMKSPLRSRTFEDKIAHAGKLDRSSATYKRFYDKFPYTCMYLSIHTYACIHSYMHTYIHIYVYVHSYTHVHMHTCTKTNTHTYKHTSIHTYMNTLIHT